MVLHDNNFRTLVCYLDQDNKIVLDSEHLTRADALKMIAALREDDDYKHVSFFLITSEKIDEQ